MKVEGVAMKARTYASADANRRADGRWRIRARAFLAQTGKKQAISTRTCYGDTKEAAAAAANKFVADECSDYLKTGTVTKPCKDTLAVYGRNWLNARKPKTSDDALKLGTWDGYSEVFRMYVEEPTDQRLHLGRVPMERLTIEHVVALYTQLRDTANARGEKNWARAKTLNTVLRPVFSAYYSADPKTRVNLAAALRERKLFGRRRGRKRPQAYTWEQLVRFLKAASTDRYRAFWYLFAFTGARPSELLALTRDDVDLAGAKMTISKRLRVLPKTLPRRRGEAVGHRHAQDGRFGTRGAVARSLVPILRQHLDATAVAGTSAKTKARKRWVGPYGDLLFTTQAGHPVDWGNLRDSRTA